MPAGSAETRKHASTLRGEGIDLTVGKDAYIGRSGDDASNFNIVVRQMLDQIRKDAARAAGAVCGPRYSDLK
jgi:hypothetical protein